MRERPKKRIDPSSGYPSREDLAWQSDNAFEMLTDFMNKMGEDIFVKHGIEIVNRYGRKHFKTKDDLLTFMQEAPKMMKCYMDMHGKEAEREKESRPKLHIVVDDECLDD